MLISPNRECTTINLEIDTGVLEVVLNRLGKDVTLLDDLRLRLLASGASGSAIGLDREIFHLKHFIKNINDHCLSGDGDDQ